MSWPIRGNFGFAVIKPKSKRRIAKSVDTVCPRGPLFNAETRIIVLPAVSSIRLCVQMETHVCQIRFTGRSVGANDKLMPALNTVSTVIIIASAREFTGISEATTTTPPPLESAVSLIMDRCEGIRISEDGS